MSLRYDDAVVGAGIVGLAHAYHLARQGRRVIVFERHGRAMGASVRNFGMIWPIGQPAGPPRELAMRSREIWLDVLREAGLWHGRVGSLHLAYRDDEARILSEFAVSEATAGTGSAVEVIDAGRARAMAPGVRRDGLKAALWSPAETCVDPRAVVERLPAWLAETYGARFELGLPVLGYDRPRVLTPAGDREADRLWACTGDEFHALYPDAYREAGLVRCKLQMMRSAPAEGGWRLGPMLAGGLTLRHYRSFEHCPSLPALKARVAAENPELDRHGIHVMASQNDRGEVVIGDSHAYGDPGPFDDAAIDALILGYLATFLEVPGLRIASRWHGTYAKHPRDPYVVASPAPGAVATIGLGGAGMTLSFGVAEKVVRDQLEGN
ncbi:TIGR03364 family FAD-dependent oxidoreductase [Aquisphaera insulae]|uniref:TIGR03364 family FAD-dependent oxidoreductase n=1 Tax=Aquisphaera insulae TaxID=2712864 RepID=UPI0013EB22E9|nr:TIGR03364 family FAD-dependent oxidoreductase [Aquisphaera insulae]